MKTIKLHAAAVAYAERGLPVLPLWGVSNGECACPQTNCPHPGKHPIGNLVPNGVKDACSEPHIVAAWWERYPKANIGIATGASAGFDALDVDGEKGKKAIAEYEAAHGRLPRTPLARTGGGGFHLLFAYVEGLGNKVGILHGVDIRAHGGYIVAPPSTHASGRCYEWAVGLDETAPQPWPDALLGIIRRPRQGQNAAASALPLGDIPGGSRNSALTSLGGTMRRRGMGQAAIEAGLLAENLARCVPPLSDPEVRRVAASVVRYEPTAPVAITALPCSDLGNAQRLIRFASGKLRFVQGWGWIFFDGRRWLRNAAADATELMKRATRGIWVEAQAAEKDEVQRRLAKWAIQSQSVQRIRAALDLARSDALVRTGAESFDQDHSLLNVANGTVDLRDGKLRPHDRADLLTRLADVEFDPAGEAPRWRDFLRCIVPDEKNRAFLRRWFGYCLTGDTSEQVLLFLHGIGANGKTVLIETVRSVLGEYSCTTPFTTFVQRNSGAASNDIAALVGVRMVVASEPDQGVRLSEAVVKQVTGGERISARFLYKEFFEYQPLFKICLVGNHRPEIKGTDHGIWRRILLLPFPIVVPKDEQDRRLGEKLSAEAGGILAWMVRGCREWTQVGLRPPASVLAATEEYRTSEDRFGAFLAEVCQLGSDLWVASRDLRAEYAAWCEQEGEQAESAKWVAARLVERGLKNVKRCRQRAWVGIAIRGRDA